MSAVSKGLRPLHTIRSLYQLHSDFILLLILFTTFRILALAAYRPGGLVLDFSDFYWYRSFAETTRQGYYPYQNLWTTYPPLFPVVMIAIYQISSFFPPWEHVNLWFTLLLGGFFLLFEIGNFILFYLLALKLYPVSQLDRSTSSFKNPIRPCWIYAALFVPVYTLTGHFESYPIFFFLLSLYLLLENRPYLSAFFTGIGFMIKLIPALLIPIAAQLISDVKFSISVNHRRPKFSRVSSLEAEEEPTSSPFSLRNPSFRVPFDIPRVTLYVAIFVVTVLVIAIPFYRLNPNLILAPFQISAVRLPWETVWALFEGNYNYGAPPLDRRNIDWNPAEVMPGHLPWLWISAVFGLVYLWVYTRPLSWKEAGNILAFAGFTLCLFMLWSKGYSPQWLGWPLLFIALLLPNIRGVTYAVILSLANIIEANFFFIMFPEERWLFATTVLIRTLLLLVVALEFLWLIWPQSVTAQVKRVRGWGLTTFVVLLIIGSIPAIGRLGSTYFDMRQSQSPYGATITRLQNEQVTGILLLNDHFAYDWFYPYLRHNYTFQMLDDYAPPSSSVSLRTTAMLDEITTRSDVLWIYDADASVTTPSEEALATWLGDRPPAHIQDIDGGRLYLFILRAGP